MKTTYLIVGVLLIVAALGASLLFYPQLPETIPTHWDIHGQVDGHGSKSTVFLLPGAMAVCLVLLFWVLPWLSPKRFEVESFRSTYLFIAVTVLALLAYLHGVILWTALHPPVLMERALVGGICLFAALLGNVLGKVRRNFWMGVRTPWTIADERVWNATHRFAARVMVAAGVLGFIGAMVGYFMVGIVALAASAIASVLYSLIYYKQLEKAGEL
jgi:uncharacterized membrane protein